MNSLLGAVLAPRRSGPVGYKASVGGGGGGERGEPGYAVAEHLGGDAVSEHHDRAEHRFLHDADDGLDAAGDHGLHEHSGQPTGRRTIGRSAA